jgi:hypothetical protein
VLTCATAFTDAVPADAAADDSALDTATDTQPTSKRQRNGGRAPPSLSCKRQMLLFTGALEDALLALKTRLPAGYFQVGR